MDELGSALRHSDEPNFRVAPFLFMPEGKLESAIRFLYFFLFLNIFCSSFYKHTLFMYYCAFVKNDPLIFFSSFTILWPVHNVQKGDECTRDYLFGIGEDKQRSARLTAWFHTPQNYFVHVLSYL